MIHTSIYRISSIEPAGDGWRVRLRIPDMQVWSRIAWLRSHAAKMLLEDARTQFLDVRITTVQRSRPHRCDDPEIIYVEVVHPRPGVRRHEGT